MQLYEKHRPPSLAAVVGESDTIKAIQRIMARDFTGGAFYLIGRSGTGKTTIARAIAAELRCEEMDLTPVGGADVTADFVRGLVHNFALSSWGESGWKVVIVDEAHAMSRQAVQCWLPFLEALPAKRLIVFTSTEAPSQDLYGSFTAPLLSRCQVFTLEPDREAFAAHIAAIADAEGLNGQPIEAYRALVASCGSNMRAALQRIEAGEMLHAPKAVKLERAQAASGLRTADKALSGAIDWAAKIMAEEAAGRKFLPGSPKFKAWQERLKALHNIAGTNPVSA